MAKTAPVRKIGIQTRSMTGTRPDGNRYESALERDFMTLMEGHPEFLNYQAQPIWVEYINPLTGKQQRYPPDGLVRWNTDRPPLLVEVKYREDCAGHWREFRAKFRAAKNLAKDKGWEFLVVTEDDIRGPVLFNVHFLSGYKTRKVDPDIHIAVMDALKSGPDKLSCVTDKLGQQGMNPDAVVTCCWALVAQRRLKIDMDVKVNRNTLIWVDQ